MAKRDPIKTARNKKVEDMKEHLRSILPQVLNDTGYKNEMSLNAKIGGKADEFIDLQNEVISSPDQYMTIYLKGFKKALNASPPDSAYHDLYERLGRTSATKEYLAIFLKRSYLKHHDELFKKRPHVDEAEVWIGQNNADYGILIAPRHTKDGWENDKSEIRHFSHQYWSIGHILHTGLVVPDDGEIIEFSSVENYLSFFKNTLVRASGSPHEKKIAKLYCEYVKNEDDPEKVPLLIPEFRYEGLEVKHKYRLDFTIIDPFTLQRIGFELSPWSTHGYLSKIGKLTQKKINEMAASNFDKEMKKHKSFFKKHGIYTLIYTDEDLKDISSVFEDMKKHLNPINTATQLDFNLMDNFFD